MNWLKYDYDTFICILAVLILIAGIVVIVGAILITLVSMFVFWPLGFAIPGLIVLASLVGGSWRCYWKWYETP